MAADYVADPELDNYDPECWMKLSMHP